MPLSKFQTLVYEAASNYAFTHKTLLEDGVKPTAVTLLVTSSAFFHSSFVPNTLSCSNCLALHDDSIPFNLEQPNLINLYKKCNTLQFSPTLNLENVDDNSAADLLSHLVENTRYFSRSLKYLKIQIHGHDGESDEVIKSVLKQIEGKVPYLETLLVSAGFGLFTSDAFEKHVEYNYLPVVKSFPSLRELSFILGRYSESCMRELALIGANCRLLESLDLNQAMLMEKFDVKLFTDICIAPKNNNPPLLFKNLSSIRIPSTFGTDEDSSSCSLHKETLRLYSHIIRLKNFTVYGAHEITDTDIENCVENLHCLEKIMVMDCPKITDRGLEAIGRASPNTLTEVVLHSLDGVKGASLSFFTSVEFLSLTNLPALEKTLSSSSSKSTNSGSEDAASAGDVNSSFSFSLNNLARLNNACLSRMVGDLSLLFKSLPARSNMKHITVQHCPDVNFLSIEALSCVETLETVGFDFCSGLFGVKPQKQKKSETDVNDDDDDVVVGQENDDRELKCIRTMKALASIPSLTGLRIESCGEIEASHMRAFIENMKYSNRFATFKVNSSTFDDACLRELSKAPETMREAIILAADVSAAGIEEFCVARPDVMSDVSFYIPRKVSYEDGMKLQQKYKNLQFSIYLR